MEGAAVPALVRPLTDTKRGVKVQPSRPSLSDRQVLQNFSVISPPKVCGSPQIAVLKPPLAPST